jgi:hypothetical protein
VSNRNDPTLGSRKVVATHLVFFWKTLDVILGNRQVGQHMGLAIFLPMFVGQVIQKSAFLPQTPLPRMTLTDKHRQEDCQPHMLTHLPVDLFQALGARSASRSGNEEAAIAECCIGQVLGIFLSPLFLQMFMSAPGWAYGQPVASGGRSSAEGLKQIYRQVGQHMLLEDAGRHSGQRGLG